MSGSQQRLPVAHIPVDRSEAGMRLDRWMKRRFPGLAPSAIAKMARTGQTREEEAFARSLVLHEDDWVIAIAKPAGLPTQGGPGIHRHVDRLAAALRRKPDDEPPRLVHRLDRETTGVLLLGRTAKAAARLAASLRSREAEKLYWAVVAGVPRPSAGEIAAPLRKQARGAGARVVVDPGGKPARSRYRVLARAGDQFAWVQLAPLTGRTHQLRVHVAHIGHPILGDRLYGGVPTGRAAGGLVRPGLHLHARRIRLPHPADPARLLDVRAPLPAHMRTLWEALGWDPEDAAADEPPRT